MAANLYARSIFGEDALANLSVEKSSLGPADAPVQGHIRIRAKSQVSYSHLAVISVVCISIACEALLTVTRGNVNLLLSTFYKRTAL